MHRRLFTLGLALVILSTASSVGYTQAPRKNFLWKVKSKTNTVYLLGSIHVLKKEDYPLSRVMESGFEDAKVLVLETDMDSLSSPSAKSLIMSKATIQGDETLQNRLSKETYNLLAAKLKELGVPILALNRFEPWFVGLMLTNMKIQQLGFSPELGIDKYFLKKAKVQKKEVKWLETVEYQLSVFDEMSPKLQEAFLLQTIKEWENIEREFNKMVRFWATGDVKQLEDLILAAFKSYPEVFERVMVKRNRNWLPLIEGFLKEDRNYIVVVGAGHLVGNQGLVEMLRKSYAVEQL
jgi:uncharacterized protein